MRDAWLLLLLLLLWFCSHTAKNNNSNIKIVLRVSRIHFCAKRACSSMLRAYCCSIGLGKRTKVLANYVEG